MAEDARFLERLRARDERAFNKLILQNQGRVYALLVRMLKDPAEAEEVAQEVFVTVFKSIETFRGDAKISTWIYRIAVNHARNRIKYLSRRARGRHQDVTEMGDRLDIHDGRAPDAPDAMLEAKLTHETVQRALSELPEGFREIFMLREVEKLSYEEIEQRTGLAKGTVKSRLFRARKALQEEFDQLELEEHDG